MEIEQIIESIRGMSLTEIGEYFHTLPKGVPARVMSKIFDRAGDVEYTRKLNHEMIESSARSCRAQESPYNPWAFPSFF